MNDIEKSLRTIESTYEGHVIFLIITISKTIDCYNYKPSANITFIAPEPTISAVQDEPGVVKHDRIEDERPTNNELSSVKAMEENPYVNKYRLRCTATIKDVENAPLIELQTKSFSKKEELNTEEWENPDTTDKEADKKIANIYQDILTLDRILELLSKLEFEVVLNGDQPELEISAKTNND